MNSVFRFENPAVLQFFWLVPALVVLATFFTFRHLKKMQQYFSSKLYSFLAASVSTNRRRWKLALECLVISLFIISLARPQSGKSEQKVKSEGIELMILFDVSRSMLAEDVKPSRLDFAKKEIIKFIDMSADRVGLIAFAGSGVLMSPLTSDRNAIKMYIESLNPESVSTQGTEFKSAINAARDAFKRGGVEAEETSVVTRAIVIVSDGEDNEPGAMDAANEIRDKGMHIFSLAVGTEKGGAIPLRDEIGNLRGYRKDKQGKVVLTRTKGEVLKNLAKEGGGSFYHLTYGGSSIASLINDIKKLEQTEFDSAVVVNYDEKYQIFLLLAIIIALIELVLGERRQVGRVWKGRFEVAER